MPWGSAGARRHGAGARAGARLRQISVRCAPVRTRQTSKFCTKVHKAMNGKVLDLTTLYNVYKGSRVFFSMDFAGTSCQLGMPVCLGKQEVLSVDRVFHQFPLKI
jgi:hypothetical protein